MKTWVRLHTDVPSNRKVQSLPLVLFKFLVNCWAFAGRSDDGFIPSSEDIAWEIREKVSRIDAWTAQLVAANLLVESSGRFIPHDWAARQFEITPTTARTRKFRERSGNKSGTVPGTLEDVSETFPKRSSRASESESVSESVFSESEEIRKEKISAVLVKALDSGKNPLTVEELSTAWERHQNYSRVSSEPRHLVFQKIVAMNGGFDLVRFRANHEPWCEYWTRKGWNAFGSITFLGWIEAGMPLPPPEASKDDKKRSWKDDIE